MSTPKSIATGTFIWLAWVLGTAPVRQWELWPDLPLSFVPVAIGLFVLRYGRRKHNLEPQIELDLDSIDVEDWNAEDSSY